MSPLKDSLGFFWAQILNSLCPWIGFLPAYDLPFLVGFWICSASLHNHIRQFLVMHPYIYIFNWFCTSHLTLTHVMTVPIKNTYQFQWYQWVWGLQSYILDEVYIQIKLRYIKVILDVLSLDYILHYLLIVSFLLYPKLCWGKDLKLIHIVVLGSDNT